MSITEVDRGWAWLVVAASCLLHVLIYGISWSAGVYNAIFLDYFDDDAVTVAWAGSILTAMTYLIAPLSSALTNRFGQRLTIIIGGLIASLGLMASFFATSIVFLYFSFGIVTGAGMGIAYIPSVSCVAIYFDKYRNLAIGIAVSGLGVGTFIFPPIITVLEHAYSWKGAMLVTAAIMLNACACGFVIRPIRRQDLRREITPIFDWSVFEKEGYFLLCGMNVMSSFSLSVVYLQLTPFAESSGISVEHAAMLVSAIGISNLVGRLIVGAMGNHPKLNVFVIYSVSSVISGVVVGFYPVFMMSYPVTIVLSVLFGFSTASFGALLPALMIDIVGLHRLETGYGFLLIFMAIGQLTGAPFAGFIFDVRCAYDISFYVGGALFVSSGVAAFFLTYLERKRPTKTLAECVIIEEKRPLPA